VAMDSGLPSRINLVILDGANDFRSIFTSRRQLSFGAQVYRVILRERCLGTSPVKWHFMRAGKRKQLFLNGLCSV
jgi:hypothetical protein